jgi:hypothetical protein
VNISACSISVLVLLTACTTPLAPTASLQSGAAIQTPTPVLTQPATVPAAPAPPAQQAPIADAAVAVPSPDLKTLEIQAKTMGYKQQVHGGKRLFCRVATPTGSHIPVNECVSPEVLQAQLTQQSAERYKLPTNTGCLGSNCKAN